MSHMQCKWQIHTLTLILYLHTNNLISVFTFCWTATQKTVVQALCKAIFKLALYLKENKTWLIFHLFPLLDTCFYYYVLCFPCVHIAILLGFTKSRPTELEDFSREMTTWFFIFIPRWRKKMWQKLFNNTNDVILWVMLKYVII